jgi:hypothetical protein
MVIRLPSPGEGLGVGLKEADGLSELEVMVYLVIGLCAEDFHAELVERVIVAAPDAYGPPGIATLDASFHADGIDLLCEGLLLFFILHLKKKLLALKFKNG